MAMPKEKGKARREDLMRLKRESAIPVLKSNLIQKLTSLIGDASERAEFLKLCKMVEYAVRAGYHSQFEDLMQLYSLFDPIHGNQRLEQLALSDEAIDEREIKFLELIFQVFEKSNFKLVTDKEIDIAQSAQYLLNLPIIVDESKLDNTFLPKHFKEHHDKNLPGYSDKYIIFHRGIGIDRTTGYFVMEKLNMIISRTWASFMRVTRLQEFFPKRTSLMSTEDAKEVNENSDDLEKEDLLVKRIRIENMELSIRKLIRKLEIQEPTFDRMIVMYRRASPNEKKDRGIHIKHFKSIPMADMELVLPEKKNPSLTPMDWVNFLIYVVLGLVTLVSSFQMPKADIRIVRVVLSGIVAYCAKIYFTFQQQMATYQNLIIKSMYDKQLDSGKGTLLHLCYDVIQQEVKEVIIPLFILMKQGELTVKDLDSKCEEFIEKEFSEKCDFEVEDAIQKLERLRLVTSDGQDSGRSIRCFPLKEANENIWHHFKELVLMKAKQPPGSWTGFWKKHPLFSLEGSKREHLAPL